MIANGKISEDGALNYVRERIRPDGTSAERRPLEEQWFGDLAYLYGRPNFVSDGSGLRPPRDPSFARKRYNANLILPKVMRSLAKISGISAQLAPLPMSTDRRDLQAARLSKQVFGHLQEVVSMRTKLRRAMMWAASCGSGFLRVSWNPRSGRKTRIFTGPDGRPDLRALLDENLMRQLEKDGHYQDLWPGDLELDISDPFQTWWDPAARGGGVGEARWMGTHVARPVDIAGDKWGITAAPTQADLRGVEYYRDILAFIAGDDFRGMGIRSERADLTTETEYFEAPLKSNNHKGRHIVIVGDRVVVNDDNVYGWLPYAKFDWFPVEGRFLGLGLVGQLRNPQRYRNEAREHTRRFLQTTGFAPLIVGKNSGTTVKQIPALHGLVIETDLSGPPPIFGQAAQLPPYVNQHTLDSEGEMDKIAAQADPTNSKLPGQLRSGVAVAAVQADNNAVLTPTSEAMLDSLAELGTKMLELAGTYYDEPRMMQVVGPDGAVEVRKFIGADLRGHYRLRVQAQPGALDSTESRQAKMYEAVQLGILDMKNPDDKILALRALNYNTSDDFMSALLQQEQEEWRTIDRMIETPDFFPMPAPWNDPQARARVLERFLNSAQFEQIDAVAQKKIVMRWESFVQMIQARMQAQAAMLEQAKGAPGQTGEPSKPGR